MSEVKSSAAAIDALVEATKDIPKDKKLHLLRVIMSLWEIDELHLEQMLGFEAMLERKATNP